MQTEEQIKKRYKSHRKWVEKNLEKYRAYHKEYNSRESTRKKRREAYRKNIEHFKKRDRDHYYKTKDRHRELYISKKYNISIEKYRDMFLLQDNVCAICKNPEVAKNRTLSVDHDHKTGKVRGLLCAQCNKALGYIKDDLSILPKIQSYLEQYGKA